MIWEEEFVESRGGKRCYVVVLSVIKLKKRRKDCIHDLGERV